MTVTNDLRLASKAKKVIYIIDCQIAGCKEFLEDTDREMELDIWLKGF